MQRLLATVVVRQGPPDANSFLYDIDWTHHRIRQRIAIPSPVLSNPGPRGGARGARGVLSMDNRHIVANFNSLLVYSDTWKLEKILSHPHFNGIHEIDADNDSIWVTSTGLDAIVRIDREGRLIDEWFLGELDTGSRDELGIAARVIDHDSDHRYHVYDNDELVTHVNSVRLHDGHPIICLKKQGILVDLANTKLLSVSHEGAGFHNGTYIDNNIALVNSSHEQRLYAIDTVSKEEELLIDWANRPASPSTAIDRLISTVFSTRSSPDGAAKAGWTRGLAIMNTGNIVVGLSPATIVEIDLEKKLIVSAMVLSEDIHEAIHGLCVIAD